MDIKSILKHEYGLGNVRTEPITHGLIDENYKIVSDQGTYFFKIYNSITEPALQHLHDELKLLHKSGIPVPVAVRRLQSSRTVARVHALYEYVQGEIYSATIPQVEAAACILGKLINYSSARKTQVGIKALIDDVTGAQDRLGQLSHDGSIVAEIEDICGYFHSVSDDVITSLTAILPEKLDSMLLHPDFTERNMLFSDNDVVLLCDWQGRGSQIVLYEIACAFTRFCTDHPFEGVLKEDRVASFKSSLVKEIDADKTILNEYAAAIPWLMIHREICNTPFRVQALSGKGDTAGVLMKALLWSRDYAAWLLDNKKDVIDYF